MIKSILLNIIKIQYPLLSVTPCIPTMFKVSYCASSGFVRSTMISDNLSDMYWCYCIDPIFQQTPELNIPMNA